MASWLPLVSSPVYLNYKVSPTLYQTDLRITNHRGENFHCHCSFHTKLDRRTSSEGSIGVFSWWVTSWFSFPWNVNLGNYSFVTCDLKVLCDPWRTWIINRYSWFYHSILRDFEAQDLRMVRVVYRKWLRYAICNMEPWLSVSWICFLQTLSVEQEQFSWLGKMTFLFPWSVILNFFRSWIAPEGPLPTPPCTTLINLYVQEFTLSKEFCWSLPCSSKLVATDKNALKKQTSRRSKLKTLRNDINPRIATLRSTYGAPSKSDMNQGSVSRRSRKVFATGKP